MPRRGRVRPSRASSRASRASASQLPMRVERGAGGEDLGDALFLQDRDVGLGDDPAHDDQHVAAAGVGQQLDHLGHQREVGPGEEGEPDGVGVLLHHGLDHLLGGLVQAGVDDLEPAVAQRPGDDLGPPVVTVEARLGHDHPVGTFHAGPRIRRPWSGAPDRARPRPRDLAIGAGPRGQSAQATPADQDTKSSRLGPGTVTSGGWRPQYLVRMLSCGTTATALGREGADHEEAVGTRRRRHQA